jgi:hypothetical protein
MGVMTLILMLEAAERLEAQYGLWALGTGRRITGATRATH